MDAKPSDLKYMLQAEQREKTKKSSATAKELSPREAFLCIGKQVISKDFCPHNLTQTMTINSLLVHF